ncbi:MAG: nucleotidyl transferase AbiEii/AbiGii toxin family protein [Candidatus Bathyarchaeia archaeon]
MPRLSEFVYFVSEKSEVKNLELIEKDIILHKILRDIYLSNTGRSYLFKGGSCLVKCYFGYYRFSVDLDFTWRNQEDWRNLGKRRLRNEFLMRISNFGFILEKARGQFNLEFKPKLEEKRYLEFGGGGRMATFMLWRDSDLIKIQVNYVERILFKPKTMIVKTLLDGTELRSDEEAYFKDFLEFYSPFQLNVYDEREILCEKVRAILTRRAQKIRDLYDLFILQKHGFYAGDLKNEILEKIRASLYYKKYRDALEKNKERLELTGEILEDPFERNLFVEKPGKEFEKFLNNFLKTLKEIASEC